MNSIQTMVQKRPDFFGGSGTHEEARIHAEALDAELEFAVEAIEHELLSQARRLQPDGNHQSWGAALHHHNQTWVGLSHQTLQTPYQELQEMCQLIDPVPGQTLVDLGAGYGRMGLVLAGLYPEVNFLGFEYVPERVLEGNRILRKFHCERAQLREQDLTAETFTMPEADYYLLYDYGTLAHIRQTLQQLEKIASRKTFKLIGRGKGTRSLIQYEHPWLAHVFEPIHREHFSIYSMSS